MGNRSLVLATKNPGKLNEFKSLLGEIIKIESLTDVDFQSPLPAETGSSYRENAELKAESVGRRLQRPVIADDSGLELEALGNEPGIYSARYGNASSDKGRRQLLLANMKDHSNRKAAFYCVIALYQPETNACISFAGKMSGSITREERGHQGFGYDSIFIPDSFDKTLAEMDEGLKNQVSHRARASELLLKFLLAPSE
jgi:XTP/dITP diphosphohydrolase